MIKLMKLKLNVKIYQLKLKNNGNKNNDIKEKIIEVFK